MSAESMAAEPFSWNVVIVGAWNIAILTPDGIAKRLFELPQGTPVQVEVPIDRPGPYRVLHDGLMVIPSSNQLEVAPQALELGSLQKASRVAQMALRALPETPVFAAGINIRYRFASLPDELIDLVKAPIDDVLSDTSFQIDGGLTKRSLALPPGILNLEIVQGKSADGSVSLNFHRESTAQTDLQAWLARVEEFFALSERVLETINARI
jgi:hypothetical protein